ncbi:hypothetical protein ANCCEY_08136 [Ancylostoma ceylanicum]|uniref:GCS light chain n=1 Tax=Ancylostoma ceylanicum TaxID=53326 RepID=A0A0D6LYU4_9BILA|nr:hypothetical protein ANCCEY_08136 [Ancylostoma ceylanicum]
MPPILPGSSFTVHTGNLNNYLELVTRRHKNSSAEISAAFKHLAAQKTVFRMTESVFSPTTEVLQHAEIDVKTSLKDLSDDAWLQKVMPIWEAVEQLVEKDVVHTIGVSDLDVDRLRLLCEAAKEHPPTIDHYSIDGCCAVSTQFGSEAAL